MVGKCCVPQCRGNYDGGEKVSVFQFPKEEGLRRRWMNAIPRKDYQPTIHSRVCQLHFYKDEVLWETSYFDERSGKVVTAPLFRPRLKEGAVPHIFPDCPSYLSTASTSREAPEEKRQRLESSAVEAAIRESIELQEVYIARQGLNSFDKLLTLARENKHTPFWNVIEKTESLLFIHIDIKEAPVLTHTAIIDNELNMKSYINGNEQTKVGKYNMPYNLKFMYELYEILELLEKISKTDNITNCSKISKLLDEMKINDKDNENFYDFFSTQLQLLHKKKEALRYNSHAIVFASMFFLISPHAYRYVRNTGSFLLPHPSTIRKICSSFKFGPGTEQEDEGFLFYLKSQTKNLNDHERFVVLMVDEIHIKKYMDYKGGSLVGSSYDSENLASSAHVFMVQSLLSSYKDVVHILPVSSLTATSLHDIIKKVVIGVEKAGLRVISVITDNNSINRKAMSFFATPPSVSIVYPHPCDASRPMFFVIDPVHIFKCIRNNWVNQRNDGKCMSFPEFDSCHTLSASFSTLRELYNFEASKLLKFGYGLSVKALWPSNIEKQNVRLVCQIFNDYIVEALNTLGKSKGLTNAEGTAAFIKIISQWWKVVNVKTPDKGRRHNDTYLAPITNNVNDHNLKFLKKFFSWLELWHEQCSSSGFLTKETFSALKHTTHALIELTSFCFEELKMKYVLLGKFQTDALEARFGLYRQLAGAQYNLSVRQVFEAETKLRMTKTMHNMKHSFLPLDPSLGPPRDFNGDKEPFIDALMPFSDITVTAHDQELLTEDLPILLYVSGYCAFSQAKRLKCDSCTENLMTERPLHLDTVEFTTNLDRGGLHYPQQQVVDIISYNYIIIKKLLASENINKFLKVKNQRSVAVRLTRMALEHGEFSFWNDCSNGHETESIVEMILRSSTNCLLNFSKNSNNGCRSNVNKRKLSTLSK